MGIASRRTTTRIYRDSEGRTRREQLSPTGEVQSVSISDPVAGSMSVLNPAAKTAQRNGVIMAGGRGGSATAGVPAGSGGMVSVARMADGSVSEAEVPRRREVETQAVAAGSASGAVAVSGGGGRGSGGAATGAIAYAAEGVSLPRTVMPSGYAASGIVNKEDLGQQVVEG